MADAADEPAVGAVSQLVPATLKAMHALEFAGRHLSPTALPQLIEAMAGRDDDVKAALAASRALDWPERLKPVRACLEPAAEAAAAGIAGLRSAGEAPQPIVAAYRALRSYATAAQLLYPMAAFLKPVSQFFLEQAMRGDPALTDRLAAVDPAREHVGVMHVGGPPGTRGGFSLYVPEYYTADRAWPLVVALHGGSGNGRNFLWNWLRDARSFGAILIAPTATGPTWALMGEDTDTPNLMRILETVRGRYNVDTKRLLMTGLSDGGTFCWVSGLDRASPFTHLAPIAATFHPLMAEIADAERLRGLPVFLVHGRLDWMFPVQVARQTSNLLSAAGADITYREIDDLSHCYPREMNAEILKWMNGKA